MKKIYILISIICVLAAGCSPKVITKLNKQYPPLNENAQVEVWEAGTPIPAKAEHLGTIAVGDRGTALQCDSLTMIDLVKDEARKAGANAVLLTHYDMPSFWSSCWQFEGLALRTDALPFDSINTSDRVRKDYSRFSIGVGIGCGWRTDRLSPSMTNPVLRELYSKIPFGMNFNAYANYYFTRDYGVRLFFSGVRSSASLEDAIMVVDDFGRPLGIANLDMTHTINYFGVSFAHRNISKNGKWLFEEAFGIGYMGYREYITTYGNFMTTTGSTIGCEYNLGIRYFLDESFSLGVTLSGFSGILTSARINDNGRIQRWTGTNGEGEGLSYFNILAGFTYSIKRKTK